MLLSERAGERVAGDGNPSMPAPGDDKAVVFCGKPGSEAGPFTPGRITEERLERLEYDVEALRPCNVLFSIALC